jgi:hypothetical protein
MTCQIAPAQIETIMLVLTKLVLFSTSHLAYLLSIQRSGCTDKKIDMVISSRGGGRGSN